MAGSELWWERPDLRYRDGRLELGIRLNPGLGAGYDERLRYAGEGRP